MRGLYIFLCLLCVAQGRETNDGCKLKDPDCFPTAKVSCTRKLKEIRESKDVISAMNENLPRFVNTEKKIEFRNTSARGVGVFAKEKIYKGEKIFDYSYYSGISSQDMIINPRVPHLSQKFKTLKEQPTFEHNHSDLMTPNQLRFAFSLLYHLYNIENFANNSDLIGLPVENEMFVNKLSDDEFTYLDPLIQENVINGRRRAKDSYRFFIKTVKALGKDALKLLFNDSKFIPFEDFAYCEFILETRTIKNDGIDFLLPVVAFLNSVDGFPDFETDEILTEIAPPLQAISNKTADNQNVPLLWRMKAFDTYEAGEEIQNIYLRYNNEKYLVHHGFYLQNNPFECIVVPILSAVVYSFGYENTLCAGFAEFQKIRAMQKILNMDSNEQRECQLKLRASEPGPMKEKIINNECEGPDDWTNTSVIDNIKMPILNYVGLLRKRAEEIGELIDHTRKKKQPFGSKKMLKLMIEERIRMAEKFYRFLEEKKREFKSQKADL